MKRFGTALLVLGLALPLTASGQGSYQSADPAQKLSIKQDWKPSLALAEPEVLVYFNAEEEDEANLRWHFMPITLRYTTEGATDTLTRMASRFSSPFGANTLVHEMTMRFAVAKFNPNSSVDTVRVALYRSNAAKDKPGSLITGSVRSFSFADFVETEGVDVTVDFGGIKTPAEFWVSVEVPTEPETDIADQAQFAIFGARGDYTVDPFEEHNPDIHRAAMWGKALNWIPYSGWYNDEDPGYYAKLAMAVSVSQLTSGVDDNGLAFGLNQNYPNPFNPGTEISYTTTERAPVTLKVFNAMGVEVATLVNEIQNAGPHSVSFDAKGLTSGNYYYTLTAGEKRMTKSMTLVK